MVGLPRSRWMAAVAGVAAAALVLSACGGNDEPSSSGSASGGTVNIYLGEPQFLTPTNVAETQGSQVDYALFTPLVKYDPKTYAPELTELAKSIETTDGGTTWDIQINPGWKFQNGEDVTASSFVDAWNWADQKQNKQQNSYFYFPIKGSSASGDADQDSMSGLKVISDTEFKVTLTDPWTGFLAALGYTAFYPLPQAAFDDPKAYNEKPIGNGPFEMTEWNHDQNITVTKWADYKGTQPHVDTVNFQIYQKDTAGYADLLAGDIDVMTTIPAQNLASAPTDLGDNYFSFPSSYYAMLGFPVYDKTYSSVDVRKAISMSIDRQEISDKIFVGTRTPADDWVSPVIPGYQSGGCGDACNFNPEEAKKLLAKHPEFTDMSITYNVDGGHKDWVEAACNQIEDNVGIKCLPVGVPTFDALLNNLAKARDNQDSFGPFRMGWIMDWPSMDDYLLPLYGCDGSSNYYGYCNPKMDSLVRKGNAAPTQDEAITDYRSAADILTQDFPAIPLFVGNTVGGQSNNVSNVFVDAYDRIDLDSITVN